MPLYEYRCRRCDADFEVLQPVGADGTDLECPDCGAQRPERQLSTFACSGETQTAQAGAGCAGFT